MWLSGGLWLHFSNRVGVFIELYNSHKSGPRSEGWIYTVLLPPMTCWVWPQVRPTFFSLWSQRFEEICAFFRQGAQYRMDRTTLIWSAASFVTDDFNPGPWSLIQNTHTESIMHDHNHNIAFAFIFYFYVCWMSYKRNIFPYVSRLQWIGYR